MRNLPEVLLRYRRHPAQYSVTRWAQQERGRRAVSAREIGLLLGTGEADPEAQALVEEVIVRGGVPAGHQLRRAVTLSLRLARRFEQAHHCPGFASHKLAWLLKEHLKLAAPDALRGNWSRSCARLCIAASLAGSGVVRHPLHVLAARLPTGASSDDSAAEETSRPTVLVQTGWLGFETEVWIYRQVTGTMRYRCHVAAYGHVNRDTFKYSPITFLDHHNRIIHRLMQLECGIESRKWPSTPRLHVWRLVRAARGSRAKLIHVNFLWHGPLAAEAARRCGLPLVVATHGSDVRRALVNPDFRESLQDVFNAAARVITPSDRDAAELCKLGCPPDKIVRLYLGAPIPPEQANVGRQGDSVNVVCVAAFLPVKGHRYLLEAFARSGAKEPRLFLTLVGDGELRAEMEEQIRHLGIAQRVKLTGWLKPQEVQQVLVRSHICVLHSVRIEETLPGIGPSMQEEGLPISLVEAAAFGLPIVATRTGGVAEICRDGENGFIVEEGDVEGMAEHILRLARDPALRSKLGKRSRELAISEFDVQKETGKLEALYDEVIAEHLRKCLGIEQKDWMEAEFEPGLVSVIVPTYNRAELVGQTLASVRAQTYRPIEVIVVDDGSTDNTGEVVRAFADKARQDLSVRCVAQQNQGAPIARNRGLLEARGEFIQFIDSDDLLEPSKLSAQVEVLRRHSAVEYVFSKWEFFSHSGKVPMHWNDALQPNRDDLFELMLSRDMRNCIPMCTGNGLYRRSLCRRLGPWVGGTEPSDDRVYNMRILALGVRFRYLPVLHMRARLHEGDRLSGQFSRPAAIAKMRKAWGLIQATLRESVLLNHRRRRLLGRVYYHLARPAFIAGATELGRDLLRDGLAVAPLSFVWLKLRFTQLLYGALGPKFANALFRAKMDAFGLLSNLTD